MPLLIKGCDCLGATATVVQLLVLEIVTVEAALLWHTGDGDDVEDGLGETDVEDGVLERDGEEVPEIELRAGEIGEQVDRTPSDDIVLWICAEKQSWKLDLVDDDDDDNNEAVAAVVTDVVVMTVVVHVGGVVSGGKLLR